MRLGQWTIRNLELSMVGMISEWCGTDYVDLAVQDFEPISSRYQKYRTMKLEKNLYLVIMTSAMTAFFSSNARVVGVVPNATIFQTK